MKQVKTNVVVVTCQIGKLKLGRFKLHAQGERLGLKARALIPYSVIAKAKVLPQMERAEPQF